MEQEKRSRRSLNGVSGFLSVKYPIFVTVSLPLSLSTVSSRQLSLAPLLIFLLTERLIERQGQISRRSIRAAIQWHYNLLFNSITLWTKKSRLKTDMLLNCHPESWWPRNPFVGFILLSRLDGERVKWSILRRRGKKQDCHGPRTDRHSLWKGQ